MGVSLCVEMSKGKWEVNMNLIVSETWVEESALWWLSAEAQNIVQIYKFTQVFQVNVIFANHYMNDFNSF